MATKSSRTPCFRQALKDFGLVLGSCPGLSANTDFVPPLCRTLLLLQVGYSVLLILAKLIMLSPIHGITPLTYSHLNAKFLCKHCFSIDFAFGGAALQKSS